MTTASHKTFLNRDGLWVVAQSLLLLVATVLSIHYREQFTPIRFQLFIAVSIFALSGFVGIAGVVTLGKNRTPFPSPLPENEVVSSGIYAIVRHPLYLSLILWAISWALFWRSLAGFGIAGLLVLFFDYKARLEERRLKEKHPEYLAYALRVRRFVPGIY